MGQVSMDPRLGQDAHTQSVELLGNAMTAPTPLEKRRLNGNASHRPMPDSIVIEGQVDRIPDPPTHLKAAGKARWEQVWGVADKWLIPDLDYGLLIRYCEGWDTRAFLNRSIARNFWVKGSVGQTRISPAVTTRQQLDAELLSMEKELGLSPVARARIHVEKRQKAPERKLDRYVAAR
jgi:P27 family predicted phage terminase small subunit